MRMAMIVTCTTLSIVTLIVLALQAVTAQTCSPAYQLTISSSDYYGLVGVTGQIPNGTVVLVTGMFAPYNASSTTHPILHYKGIIYVQFLAANTATYTYTNMTIVQVSGEMTQTNTIPATYPPGLQSITLTGIISSQSTCIHPVPEFQEDTTGTLGIEIATVLIPTITLLLANQRRRR